MSEFKGYEGWQAISLSRSEPVVALILGNPAMIDAYKAGIPANGKPFPDGAKMAKIHWRPKPNQSFPETTVPGDLVNVDFMAKDSTRSPTAAAGDTRHSTTTLRPIRSSRPRQRTRRRRRTTRNAVWRATRERRQKITYSRSTVSADVEATLRARRSVRPRLVLILRAFRTKVEDRYA